MSSVAARQPKADNYTSRSPLRGLLQRKCACGTHTPGGASCESCADKGKGLQRKLTIGPVDDPLELEADRAANHIMGRAGSVGINRSPPAIQRLSSAPAGDRSEVPESVHRAIAGSGRPLDLPIRREMEQGFGHDFSQVRVHHGGAAEKSANDVEARAYTVGNSIVFAQGQFAPHTGEGRRLLAHELTHVVQQSSGSEPGARTATAAVPPRLQRTPAAPTNASGAVGRDLSRIRIDAVADFLASSLTAPRDVNVHISDASVVHMTWMLYDPADQMIGGFSTLPGRSNSKTAPYTLQPSHFSGAGFVPGKYILRCVGLDSSHQPVVYADRDFNVLSADLTTGTALATTYGSLTYSEYRGTNATPTNRRFSVNVTIQFLPATTVNCTEVGWIQSVQSTSSSGVSYQSNINPEQDARKTPLAWSIDRIAGAPSPFYVTWRNGTGVVAAEPSWGTFGSGGATPTSASLIDTPSASAEGVRHFEACAVCRTGASAGQVYGCTTWGYSADAAGVVTMMPRGFRQMPSAQFEEARAAWNTWRTSVPAGTRPEAAPALRSP